MASQSSAMINRGVMALVLAGIAGLAFGSGSWLLAWQDRWLAQTELLAGVGLLISTIWVWLRSRPADRLEVKTQGSTLHRQDSTLRIQTRFQASNLNPIFEVTLAYVQPRFHLLSKGSLDGIPSRIRLRAQHPDETPRSDDYWQAYIISANKQTYFEVEVELNGDISSLDQLQSMWLEVDYIQYGRQLRTPKTAHAIVPIREVASLQDPNWLEREWRSAAGEARRIRMLPIPTHLLTATDQLVDVVAKYVKPLSQPGDYVAISESAVAIIQGNFRHPSTVKPGWLAQRLCYTFPSKTSLSSAYGLQALIDSSSAGQVFAAFVLGSIGKVFRIPGIFYALAGEQSALIDDVTGTLPPYDQFIVLGPQDPQTVVDQLKTQTGLEIAIVDANDLGGVKILAATAGVVSEQLVEALRKNPAGNSAEQTPVVLIRPCV